MKKTILSLICMMLVANVFATHYHQSGKKSEEISAYKVNTNKMEVAEQSDFKGYYEFYSDCSGLKSQESDLVKIQKAEYISESGKTHNIAEIFAIYERRARAAGENMQFNSEHDSDVVCAVKCEGENFTIDIYTGADAINYFKEIRNTK